MNFIDKLFAIFLMLGIAYATILGVVLTYAFFKFF